MTSAHFKRLIKRYTRVVVLLVTGMLLGIVGDRFFSRLRAYANVGSHTAQCRSMLQQISAYRDQHGSYPDQRWFASLGDVATTCEGFQWIYLNPPMKCVNGKEVVIFTATRNNERYLFGFSDNTVVFDRFDFLPVVQHP
jgi:hypothetical protein